MQITDQDLIDGTVHVQQDYFGRDLQKYAKADSQACHHSQFEFCVCYVLVVNSGYALSDQLGHAKKGQLGHALSGHLQHPQKVQFWHALSDQLGHVLSDQLGHASSIEPAHVFSDDLADHYVLGVKSYSGSVRTMERSWHLARSMRGQLS